MKVFGFNFKWANLPLKQAGPANDFKIRSTNSYLRVTTSGNKRSVPLSS